MILRTDKSAYSVDMLLQPHLSALNAINTLALLHRFGFLETGIAYKI